MRSPRLQVPTNFDHFLHSCLLHAFFLWSQLLSIGRSRIQPLFKSLSDSIDDRALGTMRAELVYRIL